jgi:hypothetical protein
MILRLLFSCAAEKPDYDSDDQREKDQSQDIDEGTVRYVRMSFQAAE